MIRAAFERDGEGRIVSFEMTGHAGFAAGGADVVCAGVSAIAQTVIGSLEDLAGITPGYILEDGHIKCTVTYPEDREQAVKVATLMGSLWIGCIQIQDSYGTRHLAVVEK